MHITQQGCDVQVPQFDSRARSDDDKSALGKTIAAARAASQNSARVVLVNERVFLNRLELAVVVGANAAYSRVGQAVGKANRMFKPLRSKAFIATQRVLREVECRATENSMLPVLPVLPLGSDNL